MVTFLQIWAGSAYLLNKILFSLAERSQDSQTYRVRRLWCWGVFLAGVPAWVIVFAFKHNWIATAVEAGGAPAMLVGLIIALRGHGSEPRWLDLLAKFSVVFGLAASFYDFGGINTLNQVFELLIAAGFLIGTYQLAKDRPQGYFWYVLGNLSCAALMLIQGYYILMAQQLVSLFFVADAYLMRRKRSAQIQ
ncbi:hypothetical protein [Pseudodesulfovibrio sp.]|uniref:hypothetical protein n=1 Tax=unclassified Pseudodesulfovibrio TaxID=2661612 RepID=UPI003B00CF46